MARLRTAGTAVAMAALLGGALAGCTAADRSRAGAQAGAAASKAESAAKAVVADARDIQPSELQVILDKARATVAEAQRDPAFGASPQLLREARAIVVVPDAVRAALVLGGQGGQGVMLARTANGGWSQTAFVTLAAASAGPQIGVQSADIVIFALSERAYQGLIQNQIKFGAEAGLTAITLGSTTELGSTPKLDADVIVWAKSQGAYAGLTVEGSVINVREEANRAFYGKPVTTAEILRGAVTNPAANPLRQALPR